MTKKKSVLVACCVFAGLLLFSYVVGTPAGRRGLPAQDGIGNFGKVGEGLYRGARPDTAAIKSLQRLGIKTIIDLQMPNEIRQSEAAEAGSNGITYTNVPMHGTGQPTDEQVRIVLSLIDSSAKPVFVHCTYGCDRTGAIIGCYRIEHDRWSGAAALQEAEQYGMSWFERGMKRYVAGFVESPGKKEGGAN